MIRQNEHGAAVIEFAVLLILLLVLVFGIIEFGFLWLQSHYIANAAREGARVGARVVTLDDPPTTITNPSAVRTAVEESVITYLSGIEGIPLFVEELDKSCCNAGDFVAIPQPSLLMVGGIPSLEVTVTVHTAEIWEPVLWNLLALIPTGGDPLPSVEQLSSSAVFAVQID